MMFSRRLIDALSWILGLAVAGGVLGLILTRAMPMRYDASVSFDVQRINKEQTEEYEFDGYYEIQASDLFSQTVISWFLTPSVLSEIYASAKIDPEISTISEFSKRFTARKYSPQNIVVSFSERSNDRAERLAAGMVNVVEIRSAELNTTQDKRALFEISGATPVIVQHDYSLMLYGLIGAMIGALLGVAIVSYRRGVE